MRRVIVPLLVGCGVVLPTGFADSAAWSQTLNPRSPSAGAGSGANSEPTQSWRTVLSEGFEGQVQGDWSHGQTDQTPADKNTFLGQFGPQVVTLALRELPPHKLLSVSFDLYVIRSWDGSQAVFGPDIWQLSLVNGPTLLRTTFNNCQRVGSDQQAYPDNYPAPPHPCWTGAAAHESLGYSYKFKTRGTVPMDAVYRIQALLPHSKPIAGLQFAAFYNDKLIENQSWGIDNLQVQIADELETLSYEQFQRDWELLVNEDPRQAIEAMWRLIAAGDNATSPLVNALRIDDQQTQREAAEGTSLLRNQVGRSKPTHETWRLRRAKRALSIIDTPQARRALWTLSEPGKFETHDEQFTETQLKCD